MADYETEIAQIEAEMERDLADSAARRAAFVSEMSHPLPNWPLRLWLLGCAVLFAALLVVLVVAS